MTINIIFTKILKNKKQNLNFLFASFGIRTTKKIYISCQFCFENFLVGKILTGFVVKKICKIFCIKHFLQ